MRPMHVQARVVSALILREMRTRFGRTKASYLWALFQPLAQLVLYSSLFYYAGRLPPIGPNNQIFTLTGIIPFLAFSNVGSRVAQASAANQALFTFPGVTVLDAVFARAILEALTFIAIGALFFLALYPLDMAVVPADPAYIALAAVLAVMLGLGFGMINLAVFSFFPAWEKLLQIFMFPLYFTAGIFFMPELLPERIGAALSWNPMLHVISLIRTGFYPDFPQTLISIRYVAIVAGMMLLAGFAFERAVRNRALRP